MNIISNIKRQLHKIDDGKMYSPTEICGLNVVLDTKMKSSVFTVYKSIKSGQLPALNLGLNGQKARWVVSGKDLKEYVRRRYKIEA